MGIVKRFRKANHNTSLSLGKVRIGGVSIAFILIIGLGWKILSQKLDLSPEVAHIVGEAVEYTIAALFVAIIGYRLLRLSARNRWAMISIFGFGALAGAVAGVLLNLGEENKGLSEYFPYDVILYLLAAIGGYIAWRITTARLQRIKLDRKERISRHRRNNI